VLGSPWNFQRFADSGYLKRNQNQGTTSFGYFKNLKRPLIFMKENDF
jgi:hypothetical protein